MGNGKFVFNKDRTAPSAPITAKGVRRKNKVQSKFYRNNTAQEATLKVVDGTDTEYINKMIVKKLTPK